MRARTAALDAVRAVEARCARVAQRAGKARIANTEAGAAQAVVALGRRRAIGTRRAGAAEKARRALVAQAAGEARRADARAAAVEAAVASGTVGTARATLALWSKET